MCQQSAPTKDDGVTAKWNSHQRHCLALMGIDKCYLMRDNASRHVRIKEAKQSQQRSPITTVTKASFKRIGEGDLSEPSTKTHVDGFATHNVASPPVSTTPTKSSEQPQAQISKRLLVIGHQVSFDDILLGQRLMSDLCLYLTCQVKALDYIRLGERDDSPLVTLCQRICDHQPDPSDSTDTVFYVIPQGEEQARQIHAFMTSNVHFASLLNDKKMQLLPPLTQLLSHPQTKQELFLSL